MRVIFSSLLIALLIVPAQTYIAGAASATSVPKDFKTGLKVSMEAIKELGLIEDPETVKRVNDIGYRVARRAAPDMPYFSFRVVDMEEPNAFALPGGFIFVTSGMLNLDLTDDELAALLGHEIIHVKNNHISRMSKRQTLMNLLYQALIIGIAFGIKDEGQYVDPVTGLVTGSSRKSEILQGSAAFGLVFQELLLRGFNRELELESDEQGMIAAAGAGFSPRGTTQLFDKMRRKIYEAPGYGYWRTHPYLEDRSGIARVLAASVETSRNPPDASSYRFQTQETFMNAVENQKEEEERTELRRMALHSCPSGKEAEDLRLWFIKQAESQEAKKEPFYRDYGKLIHTYENHKKEMGDADPSSAFATRLNTDLEKLKKEKESVRPLYEEVLARENFDTETLQRYISNYPDSPRLPEVQFRLAENLRILKKESDSVDLYIRVLDSNSEWKNKSKQSLLHMIPRMEDMSGCYKINLLSKDTDLKKLSSERMNAISANFSTLQNGYEFRRKYPGSTFEKPVITRMTELGGNVLKQGRLYQALGQYQEALDQYNQILRYCSDLPIADQVKDTITDFQEPKTS